MRKWWARQTPAKKRSYLDKRPKDPRQGRACYPNISLEAKRAHWTLHNAVRGGRVVRQPCELCGDEKADAHHEDYGRPLDVRWLCRKHHGEQHRKYHAQEAAG